MITLEFKLPYFYMTGKMSGKGDRKIEKKEYKVLEREKRERKRLFFKER